MNGEDLFDAITQVREGLVDEAAQTEPAKGRAGWLKFGAAAAAVVLVAGLGAGVLGGKLPRLSSGFGVAPPANNGPGIAPGGDGGPGHDEGSVFMSYAGPVFPLAVPSGGEELTAQREVTYDFSGWGEQPWPHQMPTTDRYTIGNPTGEDKTVTLYYPFASSLGDLKDDTPVLKVDGAEAETTLRVGSYSGGFQTVPGGEDAGLLNLEQFNSWEQYRDLLSDGRYLENALGDHHDLSDIPVTVYEFSNYWGPQPDSAKGIPNPTIRAEFDLDYSRTTVLAYGFHGAGIDPDAGHMMQSFSIPREFDPENGDAFYLFVLGDDIANLTTQGYATGGADTRDTIEAGVDVERYVTDLDSALRKAAEQMYRRCSWWSEWDEADRPDFEMYFGLLKDDLAAYGLIADEPVARYDTGWLQEMDVVWMNRVFYLEAGVTVPAGGSVTVEAAFSKGGSYDFYCGSPEGESVYGYDLMTRLDSSLEIAQQTARAVNTDGVEIVRQNYGFDWAGGVDTVGLDPAEEHYYLEIRAAQSE